MSSILDNVQPAVKKETKKGREDHGSWSDSDVDSFLQYFIFTMPDKVPLDYTVFFREDWRRSSCSSEFFS